MQRNTRKQIKTQISEIKTKLKNQNQKLKRSLNFDLSFNLCILRFALVCHLLRITNYPARNNKTI